jgi:hypothetical protein
MGEDGLVPNIANPRMSSRFAWTSAFMKPRVSPVVCVRKGVAQAAR